MKLMQFQNELRETLLDRGFGVTSIPTGAFKTPDYLVKDDDFRYLVELKEKFPDPKLLERRDQRLDGGQLHEESSPTGHNNTLSGLISDAVVQLKSSSAPVCDFRLVWLHAQGHKPNLQTQQARATLYGIATIVDWGVEDGFAGEAFYFGESEFYRHRAVLDGAVLSYSDLGNLRALFCLNDHSSNFDALRNSKFCKSFGAGVLDPTRLGKDCLVIRTGIDRNKQGEMLKLLISEYGMSMPNVMNMQYISAEIRVPPNDT